MKYKAAAEIYNDKWNEFLYRDLILKRRKKAQMTNTTLLCTKDGTQNSTMSYATKKEYKK